MDLKAAEQAKATARQHALAAHLKGLPDEGYKVSNFKIGFDLGTIGCRAGSSMGLSTECDTAACIAGHAAALFAPEEFKRYVAVATAWKATPRERRQAQLRLVRVAADALGITMLKAHMLFFPKGGATKEKVYGITAFEAGLVVEHLANTGEVDFAVAGY